MISSFRRKMMLNIGGGGEIFTAKFQLKFMDNAYANRIYFGDVYYGIGFEGCIDEINVYRHYSKIPSLSAKKLSYNVFFEFTISKDGKVILQGKDEFKKGEEAYFSIRIIKTTGSDEIQTGISNSNNEHICVFSVFKNDLEDGIYDCFVKFTSPVKIMTTDGIFNYDDVSINGLYTYQESSDGKSTYDITNDCLYNIEYQKPNPAIDYKGIKISIGEWYGG